MPLGPGLSIEYPPCIIASVRLTNGSHVWPKSCELMTRREAVGPHGGLPNSSAHWSNSTCTVFLLAS